MHFLICSVHGRNCLGWPQMGPGGFFPANPDLADILGRMNLDFENFCFLYFLDPTFLDFQVPRSPNFWISRSPDLQIPRFPGPQISRLPDAAGAGAGRTLRSQPDPSPNTSRDQIRRKEPLLRSPQGISSPLTARVEKWCDCKFSCRVSEKMVASALGSPANIRIV